MDTRRQREIDENLKAQARFLAELTRATGIECPNAAILRTYRGPQTGTLLAFAAAALAREANTALRLNLYSLFSRPEGQQYLDDILRWHEDEIEDFELQVLEQTMIGFAVGSSRPTIVNHLSLNPRKLRLAGFKFIANSAKSNSTLLHALRQAFDDREFDLEVLSEAANQLESSYNFVSGAAEDKGRRLTGRQCTDTWRFQLPDNEYGFRRASFVPYFASCLSEIALSSNIYYRDIEAFCKVISLDTPPRLVIDEALEVTRSNSARPLSILVEPDNSSKAIVMLASGSGPAGTNNNARHRSRTALTHGNPFRGRTVRVGLFHTPAPDERNLLPKALLPSDHPLRKIRPEA